MTPNYRSRNIEELSDFEILLGALAEVALQDPPQYRVVRVVCSNTLPFVDDAKFVKVRRVDEIPRLSE